MAFDTFTRDFLAFYFAFVGVHYTVRLIALHDRTGIRHAHPGRAGTPNRKHQMLFRWFRAAILVVCVARVPFPQIDVALGVMPALVHPVVVTTGIVMMLAALGWADYVHSYMHAEWRSGISDEPLGQLVTTGPSLLTRNPTFLGILTGQIGFALALPSVFSAVCLIVGAIVIRRQVEVEERPMPGRFGPAYDGYVRSVPRWPTPASARRWWAARQALATQAINRGTADERVAAE